jgi:hypothetical protein
MFRRVAIGVSIACLIGGAAYAQAQPDQQQAQPDQQDEAAPADSECAQQLAAVQEAVQDKVDANALSDADQQKVYELLDQADAACTEGKSDEAMATLANVSKMVGKGK